MVEFIASVVLLNMYSRNDKTVKWNKLINSVYICLNTSNISYLQSIHLISFISVIESSEFRSPSNYSIFIEYKDKLSDETLPTYHYHINTGWKFWLNKKAVCFFLNFLVRHSYILIKSWMNRFNAIKTHFFLSFLKVVF